MHADLRGRCMRCNPLSTPVSSLSPPVDQARPCCAIMVNGARHPAYGKDSFSIHCNRCAPFMRAFKRLHEAPWSVPLSYEASTCLCMPELSGSILFASAASEDVR